MGRKELRRRRELVDRLAAVREELTAAIAQVVEAAQGSLQFDDENPAVAAVWAELAQDEARLERAFKEFNQAVVAAAHHLQEDS